MGLYISAQNRNYDIGELAAHLNRYGIMSAIISPNGNGSLITLAPLIVEPGEGPLGVVYGHMPRENPHSRIIEKKGLAQILNIGPHSYVSPNFYLKQRAVPTVLFTAVYGEGNFEPVGSDKLNDILRKTVDTNEVLIKATNPAYQTWSLADLPPEYVDRLQEFIVGFRIPLTSLEGSWKLDRHHTLEDQQSVASKLNCNGPSGAALVAASILANVNERMRTQQ